LPASTMRLKKSKAAANEEIIALLNEGYKLLNWMRSDYRGKKAANTFDSVKDNDLYAAEMNQWGQKVFDGLNSIFPTELEGNRFLEAPSPFGAYSGDVDYQWMSKTRRMQELLRELDAIRQQAPSEYTDLPVTDRLYVEDIDSFKNVRDVNPAAVRHLLKNGRLEMSEDTVQMALEAILDVPFHKQDWGGEINDLYTANVVVNGSRVATAFLLKGKGLRGQILEIRDCGKNGDQLLRLRDSPAQLFVVQFVGNVSESVIRDIAGKIAERRSQGKSAWFCIIDGQDTARVLYAYGKLK